MKTKNSNLNGDMHITVLVQIPTLN